MASGGQGFQGYQGTKGPIGLQGAIGNMGFQGVTGSGSQGSRGLQGPTGLGSGTQGYQGNQGIQGVWGLQGIQGLQGAQGAQGAQGNQGFQGTQGAQGITAFSALQGPQGIQGVQQPSISQTLYLSLVNNGPVKLNSGYQTNLLYFQQTPGTTLPSFVNSISDGKIVINGAGFQGIYNASCTFGYTGAYGSSTGNTGYVGLSAIVGQQGSALYGGSKLSQSTARYYTPPSSLLIPSDYTSTDAVNVAAQPSIVGLWASGGTPPTVQLTVEAFFYPTVLTGYTGMIAGGNGGTHLLYIDSNGYLNGTISSGFRVGGTASAAVTYNAWNYGAYCYNTLANTSGVGPTGQAYLYLNGNLVGTQGVYTVSAGNASFAIGRCSNGGMQGNIDNVRFSFIDRYKGASTISYPIVPYVPDIYTIYTNNFDTTASPSNNPDPGTQYIFRAASTTPQQFNSAQNVNLAFAMPQKQVAAGTATYFGVFTLTFSFDSYIDGSASASFTPSTPVGVYATVSCLVSNVYAIAS
jgi:hypothetical protein